MIGLVLVSHSAKIAEGVRDLALQMAQDNIQIAVAGGLDDAENPIGTDPMKVLEAIQSVYHDDGVILMMDLGSALMSAETAIEFLDPDQQAHIFLCDAPLVEGTVAAAVQASIGSPVEQVLSEARSSLQGKQVHLADHVPEPQASENGVANQQGEKLAVVIPNVLGIHARPAARIVATASQFEASMTIHKDNKSVNAKSINQVTLLNAKHGDQVQFEANGSDATAALKAIQVLVDDNLGDDDSEKAAESPPESVAETPTQEGIIQGVVASVGLAVGTIHKLSEQIPEIPKTTSEDVEAEKQKLKTALEEAADELRGVINDTKRRIGAQKAAIFEAHLLLLKDEALQKPAFEQVGEIKNNAAAGWWHAVEAMAAQYRAADNDYLQGRATDVLDVGKRVLLKLLPESENTKTLPENSILLAQDLTPSDTAQLDPKQVVGIITEAGGANSHTAIIARSLGIPAVAGIGAQASQLSDGQKVILEGDSGRVIVQPTGDQLREAEASVTKRLEEQRALIEASQQPATTTDGRQIEIVANIGTPRDSVSLLEKGAEGVGLFRTELLFMDRDTAPTEDEQYEAYSTVAQHLGDCPIIIRTLDVGGDKTISYIDIPEEENPFLGYRGIRYWLGNPELAKTQLRAICRASADHKIKVMFPMIGTLDELHQAKKILQSARDELKAAGIAYDAKMEVGIMIEVPSAVLLASQFAREVDFFSIGTNDLTQYVMAADRGNAQVSTLINPFQPAVINAMKQVVTAAHAEDKWVGICGEMAGNPLATKLLIGLGLDELSMSVPSIPQVKSIIRKTHIADAQAMAAHVLTLSSAQAITDYLSSKATSE